MKKEEMKNYMKSVLDEKWENIRRWDSMIQGIEEQETQSENDMKLVEYLKRDKYQEVGKCIEIEKMFETMFKESYI